MPATKKRNYTIEDIVQRLMESGVDRQSIHHFSDLIDRECFVCEERFGNANRITYELRELLDFLLDRLAPRVDSGLTDEPAAELKAFVRDSLSDRTLARRLTFASRRILSSYLSPVVQSQDATA